MENRIKIKIDNNQVTVDKNLSLHQNLNNMGIEIPILCYNSNHKCDDISSCMVCAVYDKNNKTFIPSCISKPSSGSDIEVHSDEAKKFRKTAVELLLSEHRGCCIAMCQRVCPTKFPIPYFLKLIDNNNKNEAEQLIKKYNPNCMECNAKCEKACFKKQCDKAVPIKKYITDFNIIDNQKPATTFKLDNKYNHVYGKTEKNEFEKLIETSGKITGCFQCECDAYKSCKLRNTATELECSQSKYKPLHKSSVEKIISENIIFSPGKCIRCGTCIMISDLTFQNRGYKTIPAPAIGTTYAESIKDKVNQVIKECPTGAFSLIKLEV